MANRKVTLPNGNVVTIDDSGNIVSGNAAGTSTTPSVTQPVVQPNAPAVVQPPTQQLTPGMTGPAVKQLQDYLVSKGLLTAEQVATGPGTYGPATTAAVAKLQQQMGVDNSSGVGYYGPRTISALSTSNQSSQNNQTQTPAQTTVQQQTADINTFNPNYGVNNDQWAQMNDTQRAVISAAYTAKQSAYNTNGQQLTFADALTQAAKDPNIVSQYADAAKLDAQTFSQNLQNLQNASTSTGEQQQMQFENDRKQLAEQSAAKGQAYSGFRNQAQEQLGKTEAGIVQSSRSALQQQLNSATSAFESKYGTAATTPATANYNDPLNSSNVSLSGQTIAGSNTPATLTGALAGGVTGSQPIAQNNAVNAKATDLYNLANFTPQLTA